MQKFLVSCKRIITFKNGIQSESEHKEVVEATTANEALKYVKNKLERTETQKVISIKVREARGIEICDMCGAEIQDCEGFIGTDGSTICEECGDEYLDIHDWTQHDEYPYIDGEGTWDGSMYEGEQFKRR